MGDERQTGKVTLQSLRERGHDLSDTLHHHFERMGLSDWSETTTEATRLLGELLGVEIEQYSPIDSIVCAGCAASANSACKAIAGVLGIDPDIVVDLNNECRDREIQAFRSAVKEAMKRWA